MIRFLLVCFGGAVGSGLRYATALWAGSVLGASFPFGTLLVNLTGSFAIGFLMQVATTTELLTPDLRLMLRTGVLGGFTTYSTFNYETTEYVRQGAWAMGLLNIALTLTGCLVAGFAGLVLARMIFGR